MSGQRILVVDDDPDIVDYVSTFLEDHGFEVETADSSATAVTALERYSAELVIIDIMMPGRSGLDLLVTVRKDQRWSNLPIVVLTGNDQVLMDGGKSYHPIVEGGLRGADKILGKPLKPLELLDTLKRLLN